MARFAGRSGAELLEGSDDLLQRIITPLGLEDRMRLQTVSKRWQRFLLADLRFPAVHAWRAPHVMQLCGAHVRRLDVSSLKRSAGSSDTLAAIVRALCSGAAAELRSLVMWDEADVEDQLGFADGQACIVDVDSALSEEQASQLAAACPLLDATSRLAFRADGAVQAAKLLDAAPGPSALWLGPPQPLPESDAPDGTTDNAATEAIIAAEQAALLPLVRHPRLVALTSYFNECDSDNLLDVENGTGDWFPDSLYDAIAEAIEAGACALAHLQITDDRDLSYMDSAFENAEAVIEAFEAAAARQAARSEQQQQQQQKEGEQEPRQPAAAACAPAASSPRLRSLVIEAMINFGFLRAVVPECGGRSLRHLSIRAIELLVREDRPENITALMTRLTPPLRTLRTERPHGLLATIAPFLASAGCRLTSLGAIEVPWETWGDEGMYALVGETRHDQLAAAAEGLSRNRTLARLDIGGDMLNAPECVAALGAALSARAAPLCSLCLHSVARTGALELAPLLVVRGLSEIKITTGLSDAHTLVLGSALRGGGLPALRSLDLCGSMYAAPPIDRGAEAVLLALCEPDGPRLRCLRWRCGHRHPAAHVSEETLTRVLRESDSLRVLDLSGLAIRGCGAEQQAAPDESRAICSAAEALGANTALRFLGLAFVGGGGSRNLVRGLSENRALRILCLLNPEIDNNAAALLATELAAAAARSRLRDFAFVYNDRASQKLKSAELLAFCSVALSPLSSGGGGGGGDHPGALTLHIGCEGPEGRANNAGQEAVAATAALRQMTTQLLPMSLRARVRVAEGEALFEELAACAAAAASEEAEEERARGRRLAGAAAHADAK